MGREFAVILKDYTTRNEGWCICGRWSSRLSGDGECPPCQHTEGRKKAERAVRAARGEFGQDPAEGC